MDMIDIHRSNVRDHAKKMRKIVDMYEKLEEMAEAEDSKLAPLLDKAGEIVCDGLKRSGALLEVLFEGLKVEH